MSYLAGKLSDSVFWVVSRSFQCLSTFTQLTLKYTYASCGLSLLCLIVCLFLQFTDRSSRRRCSVKIGVLKNFANFTGKHLCWGLFLIKLQDLQAFRTPFFEEHLQTAASVLSRGVFRTLSKKSNSFPVNIAKFLRTAFLQNTSGGCFSLIQEVFY